MSEYPTNDKPSDSGEPIAATSSAVAGRQHLGGKVLIRMLGQGGMGEVWLAHDPSLERKVAIKLMLPELAREQNFVARFYREARAVARLNHPNIVQIHQIGEEDGLLFYVMEWIAGQSVEDIIHARRQLPLDETLGIMVQACEGLSYACDNGVIHRDIKPGNVMLDQSGRVKIADFGLAKLADQDIRMTTTGVPIGSPSHMSPEQVIGEETDFRSDIYSLGIMFFQLLAGELPFRGGNFYKVMMMHAEVPLPEPDALKAIAGGAALAVIKRMTAKKPADRFDSYAALIEALGSLKGTGGFSSRIFADTSGTPSSFGALPSISSWNPSTDSISAAPTQLGKSGILNPSTAKWWLAGAGAVFLAAVGFVYYLFFYEGDYTPRPYNPPAASPVVQSPVPEPPSPGTNPGVSMPPAGGPGPRSNAVEEIKRTVLGSALIGNYPEFTNAYLTYDFVTLAAIFDKAAANNAIMQNCAASVRQFQAALTEIKGFRPALEKVIAAYPAGQKPALNRNASGSVSLTGVTAEGLTAQTAQGQTLVITWPDISPPELQQLGHLAFGGPDGPNKMDALSLFIRRPEELQDLLSGKGQFISRPGMQGGQRGGPGGQAGGPGGGQGQPPQRPGAGPPPAR
ncbi:MAG: protein kinase [Candidatus Sumerlaeaceae bacterium]|nr:protein kinase [Candidatus Sumerlaeaceae bacterium]